MKGCITGQNRNVDIVRQDDGGRIGDTLLWMNVRVVRKGGGAIGITAI